MISVIVSIIMFLLTLPIKTLYVGLKVGKVGTKVAKTGAKIGKTVANTGAKVGKKVTKGGASILNKGNKGNKGVELAKFGARLTKKGLKLALKSVKFAIFLIRSLALVIGVIGFVVTLLLTSGLLSIVGSCAAVLLLLNKDGKFSFNINNSSYVSEAKGNKKNNSAIPKGDGSIYGTVEYLAKLYIKDVVLYSKGTHKKLNDINLTVRADCTGFATAVIQYFLKENGIISSYSEINTTDSWSMLNKDGAWAKQLTKNGFVYLKAKDMSVSDLQPGDLLICGGHAEYFIDKKHRFGWGSAQDKFPIDNVWTKNKSTGGFSDGTGYGNHNNYTVVYRYVGKESVKDEE